MSQIWMDVDTALATVPVNIMPLIDDTDFKSIEDGVVFNQAGLALFWNFTTTDGVTTVTAVTPTSAGDYDWTDFTTSGLYGIEIPATGGASANNDTEGFGHFTGVATGILPWRGPIIGFRAAALNNALIDGGDLLDVNLTEMGGVAQSATDLKDFADAGYDPATNKVQGVLLVDTLTTYTNNTPQSADNDTKLTTIAADVVNIDGAAMRGTDGVDTATMRGTDNAATSAKQDTMETTLDAIPTTAMRGTDNALLAANQITVSDILTTQMTEAYASNGIAPTMAESLFAIHQMLMEFSIAGTAYTVKKLDSSTTAFIVTLSDATNPTGNTR